MIKKLMGFVAGLFFVLACLLPVATPPATRAEDFSATRGPVKWKVYEYNRHRRLRATRNADRVPDGIAFDFLERPDTALLATTHHSYEGDLLGDMTGKVISTVIGVTVDPLTEFGYYGEPHLCLEPASVRMFFQTDTSGPFEETDYWYSEFEFGLEEMKASGGFILISPISVPSLWRDHKGHPGSDPDHTDAFTEAVKDVRMIGLAFGGGCAFDNGVGIRPDTGSGYFRLMDFSASP